LAFFLLTSSFISGLAFLPAAIAASSADSLESAKDLPSSTDYLNASLAASIYSSEGLKLSFAANFAASSAFLSLTSSSIAGLAFLPAAIAAYSAFFLAADFDLPSDSASSYASVAASF
jgi:hypothetical protein